MQAFYTCPMALRIKQLRESAGLSQQLLAEKAGVSRSQLSEIENEVKPANTLRLNAIAAALGVAVDELFEAGARDSYLAELDALWPDLSDDDRKTLIRMAEAFARR